MSLRLGVYDFRILGFRVLGLEVEGIGFVVEGLAFRFQGCLRSWDLREGL